MIKSRRNFLRLVSTSAVGIMLPLSVVGPLAKFNIITVKELNFEVVLHPTKLLTNLYRGLYEDSAGKQWYSAFENVPFKDINHPFSMTLPEIKRMMEENVVRHVNYL